MGFFKDLLGKSGEKAANAAAEAQAAANARARGDIEAGYTSAQGRISPYADAGSRGFNAYNDAIGVNGAEGYGRAKANFDADPFRAGEQDQTNLLMRNMFRRYNGMGLGNSGSSGAAVARIGAERYGQQVADYRSRLAGAGAQGYQAAGALAGLDENRANLLSGNSQNVGNIEANRLMQGYAARQAGVNNVMGLVGGAANLLMAGITPGAKGVSAFGNLASALRSPSAQGNWSTVVYPGA